MRLCTSAIGESDLDSLGFITLGMRRRTPQQIVRMKFVSNHDTVRIRFEHFGDALEAAIVLSVVGEGMPLIYNGQEAEAPSALVL